MEKDNIKIEPTNKINYDFNILLNNENTQKNIVLQKDSIAKINQDFAFDDNCMILLIKEKNLIGKSMSDFSWNGLRLEASSSIIATSAKQNDGVNYIIENAIKEIHSQLKTGLESSTVSVYAKSCGYLNLVGCITGFQTKAEQVKPAFYYAINPHWNLGRIQQNSQELQK